MSPPPPSCSPARPGSGSPARCTRSTAATATRSEHLRGRGRSAAPAEGGHDLVAELRQGLGRGEIGEPRIDPLDALPGQAATVVEQLGAGADDALGVPKPPAGDLGDLLTDPAGASGTEPRPRPRAWRPPEAWLTDPASRASTAGSRNEAHSTSEPTLSRSVCAASQVLVTIASYIGWSSAMGGARWSMPVIPTKPAASAAWARATSWSNDIRI